MKKPVNKILFISYYHDTRSRKEGEVYPVKLRVFHKTTRKQKLYSTKFDFNVADFRSIWETLKPREKYKAIRNEMQGLLLRAEEEAESLTPFTFESFERQLFSKRSETHNVFYWYDPIIQRFRDNQQYGTAGNYEMGCKSLKEFLSYHSFRKAEKLLFQEVTSDFLENYENWMRKHLNRSVTTVSMYLRTLRTVFNAAIDAGEIGKEIYPFGKRKYQVPAVRNVKKALSRDTLKTLHETVPENREEERAKDFFFFSYACNGINMKDIALLKFSNLKGDTLQFIRAKTERTAKADNKVTVVYLSEFTKGIIEKYASNDRNPDNYIFSILSNDNTPYENFRKVKNFTRSINQAIKKMAKAAGITENISTYSARHSFATNAIRNGASMEYVSNAMGHSTMKQTQTYFEGFEEETKRQITESLMNF